MVVWTSSINEDQGGGRSSETIYRVRSTACYIIIVVVADAGVAHAVRREIVSDQTQPISPQELPELWGTYAVEYYHYFNLIIC